MSESDKKSGGRRDRSREQTGEYRPGHYPERPRESDEFLEDDLIAMNPDVINNQELEDAVHYRPGSTYSD